MMDLDETAEQMQQKREIATIKPRSITVDLSDADCQRILERCAENGMTVGDLVKNFVGDLIYGTYTNGSDEREYANQWFNRCWFANREKTLLCHLLDYGYDPAEYLTAVHDLRKDEDDKEYMQNHPEECCKDEDDLEMLTEEIENVKKYIEEMDKGFKATRDIDSELEIISRWVAERKAILG